MHPSVTGRLAAVLTAVVSLTACSSAAASAQPPSASASPAASTASISASGGASAVPAVSSAATAPATLQLRGTVLRVGSGTLTLKTATGIQTVDLAAAVRAQTAAGVSVPLQAGQGVSLTATIEPGRAVVRSVHLLTTAVAGVAAVAASRPAAGVGSVPSAQASAPAAVRSSSGPPSASAARAPARRRRQAAAVTVAGAVRAVAAGSLQVAPASGPVVTLLLGRHPRVRLAQKGSRPQPASMAQVRVGASVRIRARQTKKGLVAHSLLVLG